MQEPTFSPCTRPLGLQGLLCGCSRKPFWTLRVLTVSSAWLCGEDQSFLFGWFCFISLCSSGRPQTSVHNCGTSSPAPRLVLRQGLSLVQSLRASEHPGFTHLCLRSGGLVRTHRHSWLFTWGPWACLAGILPAEPLSPPITHSTTPDSRAGDRRPCTVGSACLEQRGWQSSLQFFQVWGCFEKSYSKS